MIHYVLIQFAASSDMWYESSGSSFRSAVETTQTVNTRNLDDPYQISPLYWINETHVSCSVPNTKGVALTTLVGVTHDYCVSTKNYHLQKNIYIFYRPDTKKNYSENFKLFIHLLTYITFLFV